MTPQFDPVEYLNGLPADASITPGEVRRIWQLGMELAKFPVLVELGVWQGRSAVLLAKIAQERKGTFYGFDHFQHPGCSRLAVVERLSERGLAGVALIIKQATGDVEWALEMDFLHIDADHTSPGIDHDCEKFIPLVRAGGVIAFDDYAKLASEPHYPDVKLVADVWCRNEAFDDLGVTDGMWFVRRRP